MKALRPHPYDWLILAGDVGESEEHLRFALGLLAARFARLLWVPGNHDLYTYGAVRKRAFEAALSPSRELRQASRHHIIADGFGAQA